MSPFCHTPRNIRYCQGSVESNTAVAEKTFHIVLTVEEPLPVIRGGQFMMLRLPKRTDPLLGRPLAVYRSSEHRIEALYVTAGKMTHRLAEVKRGELLNLWTPLGNGFPNNDVCHTILVAGGIGQTPFLLFVQQFTRQYGVEQNKKRLTLLYGAKTQSRIAGMDDFRQLGIEPMIATEDGSLGYSGFVTDLIQRVYGSGETTQVFCCGPMPMLHAAFSVTKNLSLPCYVSLETPMSCGLGICFGCAVKYKTASDSDDWDYRRTCIDGPVFDAYRLVH
ncbi:MAG: dihydroorotate dehydrogenase electron transfer subunit [Planctomycetaceae bacterium]|jgi:dihydroorotate dehydrogenase electron transfer subunit|nr:dihydroorotate dehydrogenase electron transfer subunit [Planctomycetaceae bacterium]